MAHSLYATKDAKTSYHPIPSTLSGDDVLNIFLDPSTLARIFSIDQRNSISEEKQVAPNTTEFRIGPASGSGPGPSAARGKARITSHKEAEEVVVQEDMSLGIKMNLVYRLCDRPAETKTADSDQLLSGSSSGLYLEVERSVLAPRPLSFLVKTEEGPILKTRNLICVLEELGKNGKDLEAALGRLSGRTGDCYVSEASLEKNKAD